MDENKQIEEMAKCCTYYHKGECWVDATDIGKCDLMCEMFGVFANLEAADYRKQKWISVEERLPENDYEKHWKERQRFLVYTEPNGLMYVAKYGYKEYGWWSDGGGYVLDEKNYRKVTHWMLLPQPPKGE